MAAKTLLYPKMIHLTIFNISKCPFLSRKKTEKVVSFLLRAHGINNTKLSIIFVTDRQIKTLNRLYRRKNRYTDVLSFAMREGVCIKKDADILGDIVISVDRARAQAKIFGTSFKEEMELYIIHGVLHLLGYDDEKPAAGKKMREKEKELMPLWQKQGW